MRLRSSGKIYNIPDGVRQTGAFYMLDYEQKQIRTRRQPAQGSDLFVLVDVNGLEPLTLRTSSECSTS